MEYLFYVFILNLSMTLYMKWVSCREALIVSFIFQFKNICLLVVFRPHIFLYLIVSLDLNIPSCHLFLSYLSVLYSLFLFMGLRILNDSILSPLLAYYACWLCCARSVVYNVHHELKPVYLQVILNHLPCSNEFSQFCFYQVKMVTMKHQSDKSKFKCFDNCNKF
jgi:hypothetical protein